MTFYENKMKYIIVESTKLFQSQAFLVNEITLKVQQALSTTSSALSKVDSILQEIKGIRETIMAANPLTINILIILRSDLKEQLEFSFVDLPIMCFIV